MKSIDELSADMKFTTAKTGADKIVTFLPYMAVVDAFQH